MNKEIEFRADLHCHSYYSDGMLSPMELIDLAKAQGLSGLSITDHDTIDAYEEATSYAMQMGLQLGRGVEFSCHLEKHSVHLLGYGFEYKHPLITDFCRRHQERREHRNREILAKLKKQGIVIEESDLPSRGSIGRPHIARIMMAKNYVTSIKEAFQKYLGERALCYAAGEPFTVDETIAVIHAAQGKAVIAHPHLMMPRSLVYRLLQFAFDGIECYYGRFTRRECQLWLQIAKERNWLVSGGSDFHNAEEGILGSSFIYSQHEFNALFS